MSKKLKETIHSDILVHWTGKDFDKPIEDGNKKDEPSTVDPSLCAQYLQRLKDILSYGFWVNDVEEDIEVNSLNPKLNKFPVSCFTELKLSSSRKHAFKYGRLGVGLKRMFLVNRGGQPVHYLHNHGRSLFFPPYVADSELASTKYAFFKKMNAVRLQYDLFAESEWRVVYDKSLSLDKYYVNPRGNLDEEFKKYSYSSVLKIYEFKKYSATVAENSDLKFLLPVDGWLAMIIYPSPDVKNAAYEDQGVRELIRAIKLNNSNKIGPEYEQKMMPVEIDLDLCDYL